MSPIKFLLNSSAHISVDQNQIDDDSVLFVPINEPLKTDEEVLGALKLTALMLLSDMHANPCVNRQTAEFLFKNVKETILAKVCKAIRSKIEHSQLNDNEQKNDILNFVDSCSKVCDYVDTKHKFFKHLTTEKLYSKKRS